MRSKKLIAGVMAGMLAAASVMPVMAADGGTIDVTVSTKTAVLRVEVPTSLVIAVDQFEMVDSGMQIYSEEFGITNKSEVNVKVDVESTATAIATLVGTVAEVKSSTNSSTGDAWLAVAAQTSEDKYDDGTVTDIKDLTEANTNVAVFDKTSKKAAQTFYLAEGSGDTAYSLLYGADADEIKANAEEVPYAQFYLLSKDTSITNQDTLDEALEDSDIYTIVTANEANGLTVSKLEKGKDATWSGANSYYTIADARTEIASLDPDQVYAYGETGSAATTGGVAAFRYIGHLCDAKESWTNADISKVSIKYEIAGVTQTNYDAVKDDVNYGLYGGIKYVTAYGSISSGKVYIGVNASTGFSAEPTSVTVDGTKASYTYKDGWVSMTTPDAGSEIVLLVNGTYYKLTIE